VARLRIYRAVWTGALQLAIASAVHAVPLAEVSADASASFLPSCSQASSGATAQTTAGIVTFLLERRPRVVRAYAIGAADAPDVNLDATFASSRAYARFDDTIVFVGPANMQATIRALVSVHGSVVSHTFVLAESE
jgi:hypothetical protein